MTLSALRSDGSIVRLECFRDANIWYVCFALLLLLLLLRWQEQEIRATMLRGWVRAATEVERWSRWRCVTAVAGGRELHSSAVRCDSVPNPEELGIPEDQQKREPTDRVKRIVDEIIEVRCGSGRRNSQTILTA